MQNQNVWSRRTFLRFSGGAASVVLLAACQPIIAPRTQVGMDSSIGNGEVRFAYVGSYNRSPGADDAANREQRHPSGIAVFAVTPDTGAFTQIDLVPSDNPSFLALHPTQRNLYVCNEIADYGGKESGSLEAYTIDEKTGKLTLLNRQAVGATPTHLAIDPSGRFLIVANYRGASYQVLPIHAEGDLGEVIDEFKPDGSGPHERQKSPHPCHLLFDPNRRYLATADFGSDTLETFRLDNGKLSKISKATVAAGSGPRRLAFHPSAATLYVSNELTGTITVFAYDANRGQVGSELQTLSLLSNDFSGPKRAVEIKVHSSGKFLYASNPTFEQQPLSNLNFEQQPLSEAISIFSIDETTGKLGSLV